MSGAHAADVVSFCSAVISNSRIGSSDCGMQSTTLSVSEFDSVYFGGSESRGCCVCSARRRFVYLQLLAWLPVLSLYADAFIAYVFINSENPTWGGLCALFTAAGWAVSAHQALRHSSLSAPITIALAALGMGPIAIVVGNKAYLKVKHAHERLNKLKLLAVIVQGTPATATQSSALFSLVGAMVQ